MKYYKCNPNHTQATICDLGNGLAVGDPCQFIPRGKWTEFLAQTPLNTETSPVAFAGVPFVIHRVDGDGWFSPGIAVDSGMIAAFPLQAAVDAFNLKLEPV